MITQSARLNPVVDPWGTEYWAGLREGVLSFQRCNDCEGVSFPPRKYCRTCASTSLRWCTSEGQGSIYSYSLVERGALEEFQKEVPYVIAVVELAEGYRMVSRIVESARDDVACGASVQVVFNEGDLPVFRIVGK